MSSRLDENSREFITDTNYSPDYFARLENFFLSFQRPIGLVNKKIERSAISSSNYLENIIFFIVYFLNKEPSSSVLVILNTCDFEYLSYAFVD